VVATIPVGRRPWNMALTPDGRKLYVANGRSDSVSVIDTAALKVVAQIAVGTLPWGVAIARAAARDEAPARAPLKAGGA
jgi:YVTN family beta-propeller protein